MQSENRWTTTATSTATLYVCIVLSGIGQCHFQVVCIYWTTGNDLSIHCVQSSCFIDSILKIFYTITRHSHSHGTTDTKETTNLNAMQWYDINNNINNKAASSSIQNSFLCGLSLQRQNNIVHRAVSTIKMLLNNLFLWIISKLYKTLSLFLLLLANRIVCRKTHSEFS